MSTAAHSISLGLLALLALAGCAVAPKPFAEPIANEADANTTASTAADAAPLAASDVAGAPDAPPAGAVSTSTSTPPGNGTPQELTELFGVVQSMRDLSAAEQDRLMQDLKQTDPKLWPLVTQQFRASLAYREKQQATASQGNLAASAASVPTANAASANAPTQSLASSAVGATDIAVASPRAAETTVAQVSATAARSTTPPTTALANSTATNAGAHQQPTAAAQVAPPALPAPSIAPAAPTDWRQPLSAAIESLEQSLVQSPGSDDRQVYLRLLHLMAGQRDQALEPIAGRTATEQEFWSKELYALGTLWDVTRQPDYAKRVTEAAIHFEEANGKLRELGLLVIRNLAFCTEVNSYGVYKGFTKDEFHPAQRIVLYAEVENYVSEPTPSGFHTVLHGSYQIFDTRGAKVAEQELSPMEEHCQNRRRDFFVAYSDVLLPPQMYDGRYTLKLSIEDKLGKKIAQSSIDFAIKNQPAAVAAR